MYFVNSPFLLRWYYPQVTWNKSRAYKKIYLTFDDGPIPEITSWILDILKEYKAKATFFCVGENIELHADIFQRIKDEGHQVGNHTYNHLKGWDYSDKEYLDNVQKCEELTKTNLFRPPYARAKKSQLNKLKKDFKIIYWDVLSGDFDINLSAEDCYKNIIKHTRNGSIIVLHDNIKAIPRVKYVLPKVIEHFTTLGYVFETL